MIVREEFCRYWVEEAAKLAGVSVLTRGVWQDGPGSDRWLVFHIASPAEVSEARSSFALLEEELHLPNVIDLLYGRWSAAILELWRATTK